MSFLLLLGGLAFAAPKQKQIFSGRVVGVADGDTITVLVNKKTRKVRLYGIDSPEKKQDYGMKAKQFTSSLAFDRDVSVTVMSKDRYGRFVGIVRLPDGRNLNHEIVRAGFAWWYSAYAPHDIELRDLEAQARNGKRELWSKPDAVAPWTFRRAN